ncbi:hypothetical protein GCM10009841_30950 [Microlunatus panaciterrae]|uniref:Uncharacterized protein n=1 Tax=Microlunatus panaciterrae TaxID=400768 RepID=A0ABS2RFH3_9ACTN|nr:hypothetical protein [Microlunatus panaciterrae]MBM7797754.1 hypothetical protein [Microlunatus panaciterrae]
MRLTSPRTQGPETVETGPGRTGRPGPSSISPKPYLVASTVVVLASIPVIAIMPALPDLWLHVATIEQLRENLLAPRDPMVGVPGRGNPYFSPYTVFWAGYGLFTHLGTWTVLRISAVVNLALFLVGVWRFTTTQSRRPSAPVWALAAIGLLWGTTFVYWSGFLSLPTLVAGIAYPSTFAVSVTLIVWASVLRLLREPAASARWLQWAALGLVSGVLVLTHQFTAMGAAIGCLFLVLDERASLTRPKLLGAAVTAAVVGLTAVLWPWFSVFRSSGGAEAFNHLHARLYDQLGAHYGLLLLAVPVLAFRLRRRPTDPLSLTVIVCAVIFAAGGLLHQQYLSRAFPTAALLAQIAVGVAIAEWLGRTAARRWQRLLASVCVLALGLGALGQSGTVNLVAPGHYPKAMAQVFGSRRPAGGYGWIVPHVPRGQTIMTLNKDARRMAPAYGRFTVAAAWPDPFLGADAAVRTRDSRRFFSEQTSTAERDRIARRYAVGWVIADRRSVALVRSLPTVEYVAKRPHRRQYLFRYVGPGGG